MTMTLFRSLYRRVTAVRRVSFRWWALLAVLIGALGYAGQIASRGWDRPEPVTIAFAGSLTGPLAPAGTEALAMTRIYVDDLNANGGLAGHPVTLQIHDDQSRADAAAQIARDIVAGPAVAVIGHSGDATSVAAGPVYQAGHIPVVSGQAATDAITAGNPYYFSTLSSAGAQASFLAEYIRTVLMPRKSAFLRQPAIHLVTSADNYGRAFQEGFARGDGGPPAMALTFETGDKLADAARAAADRLADAPEPRIIVVGGDIDALGPLLKAIRRRGVRSMIVLSSGAASDTFAREMAAEPEERAEPGVFSDNVFAIAPTILDNIGLYGQGVSTRYQRTTGKKANWFAASAQDAVRMLVTAMRDAKVGAAPDGTVAVRDKIREALAAVDRPAMAVTGVTGKMYFDSHRQVARSMRFGLFHRGQFVSAPLQLVPVLDRILVDIPAEMELGHVIRIGDRFFWVQRLVSTGIDITRINGVDTKAGTFNVDFFFWIRYHKGDEGPVEIEFPGFQGKFDSAHPMVSRLDGDEEYRVWRVTGDFKADFDLHDYPFDTQALVIRIRNREHPIDQIAYAVDSFGLKLTADGQSTGIAEAARDLQLWRVLTMRPFAETFSLASTLGDPILFETASRTEYGALAIAMVVQRKALTFMIKAVLPLFLLALVVFATMFFPSSLAMARTAIPVTAILTTAVLLVNVTNQLPSLGYTVALEYMFYAFFVLCLTAMLTALLAEIMNNEKNRRHVIKVDMTGRLLFLAIIGGTVGGFILKYGTAVQ